MLVRHVSQRKRFREQSCVGQVLSLLAIAGFAAFLTGVRLLRAKIAPLGVAGGGIEEKCSPFVAGAESTT